MEQSKIGHCPSCGQPAIRTGNKIECEACDAIFTVTQEGAKVKELGPIEDHERRLRTLEGRSDKDKPAGEPLSQNGGEPVDGGAKDDKEEKDHIFER